MSSYTLSRTALLSLFGTALAVPALQQRSLKPATTTLTSTPATVLPHVSYYTTAPTHGPYDGPSPTTTGALSTTVLASSIPALPPPPGASDYPSDGKLHAPEPAPYTPDGGVGTNGSEPVYRPRSDFDYESLALALYQEYIELDLFHYGLATFSEQDFEDAGLTAEDRALIEFMADQEVGHATMLTNILGADSAPRQCTYDYPVSNVREYIDFCQKLTRFGESGVYGFLPHLNSGESAQLLLQSISTEARQQMIFRQFEGLFPMPVWFEVGVPQSWAWTLLAPYINWCPEDQTRLIWQNYPAVTIVNQPNPARVSGSEAYNETTGPYTNTLSTADVSDDDDCAKNSTTGFDCSPAITHNRTNPLSYPGRQVFFEWEQPGQPIGPNNSYVTSTSAGEPSFVAWVSQLNVTYTQLLNVSDGSGYAFQPNMSTYEGDPAVNGTIFVALTDLDLFVTPFNISMMNPHVYGVALYQSG